MSIFSMKILMSIPFPRASDQRLSNSTQTEIERVNNPNFARLISPVFLQRVKIRGVFVIMHQYILCLFFSQNRN